MAIIDSYYERYNIGKMPRNKYSENASSSVTILNSSSTEGSATSTNSTIAGHYLWGNYYDATQDISGSLLGVTDITMSGDISMGGDITVQGIMTIDGDIIQGSNGVITSYNASITNINSDDIFTGSLDATTGDIDTLTSDDITSYDITTTNLDASLAYLTNIHSSQINNSGAIYTSTMTASTSITSPQGDIDTLTSQDIYTKNLTVTGSAHFFELIIDQIKAAGGALILTPADGFKVYKTEYRNYSYNGTTYQGIALYFLAEDEDHSITNMWEIGDQALIQDFNKATVGTSYNVNNAYFWSVVRYVSASPVTITGDDNKLHYIIVSIQSGEYDGSYYSVYEGADVVMLGHQKQTEETVDEAAQRQTAIYISAYGAEYGAYDPDLLAPFTIYYEGIDDFDLASHRYQWWSSGKRRTNDIPQNQFRGSFLITTGQTVKDYIDAQIDASGASILSLHGGSDIWLINSDSNYLISDTTQQWSTKMTITKNGEAWTFMLTGYEPTAYLVTTSNNTSTETALDLNEYFFEAISPDSHNILCQGFNIGLNLNYLSSSHLSSWKNAGKSTTAIIRFKFNSAIDNETNATLNYDISLTKIAKGENGSATQVEMTMYEICVGNEMACVYSDGTMTFGAGYTLKKTYTDALGNTVITTNASIPSGYSIKLSDDAGLRNITASTNVNLLYFNISDYFQGTAYDDYKEAMDGGEAPSIINIELLDDNDTVIDKRCIPVIFETGSVFNITDEAITSAIASSKSYTDNNITQVNNSISTLEQTSTNINLRVSGVQTSLQNNIDGVQGEIDATNRNLANNYSTTTTTQGMIDLSASNVTAAVTEDIDGKLTSTGIDITNRTITVTTDNFICKNNDDERTMWIDSEGNLTIRGTFNNLTSVVDVNNNINSDRLISKDESATASCDWEYEGCSHISQSLYDIDTLDILRLGDTIIINSTNGRDIVLPFYMYEDVAWDDQDRSFFLRTATCYGGTLHKITTNDMLEMIGRKITIIFKSNSSGIFWLPSLTGANISGSANDEYKDEYAVSPQPVRCNYNSTYVPYFVGYYINTNSVLTIECRLGECVINVGTSANPNKVVTTCIYWALTGYNGALFNWS